VQVEVMGVEVIQVVQVEQEDQAEVQDLMLQHQVEQVILLQ
jgi:hypothetical protein